VPVDEDLIRQITEKVTRELVAALTTEQSEPEFPDWDEYSVLDAVSDKTIEPSPIPRHNVSPLRALSKGEVHAIEDDEEGDVVEIDGVPMVPMASRSAHRPTNDWLSAQLQRDGYLKTPAPGVARERWEEVG